MVGKENCRLHPADDLLFDYSELDVVPGHGVHFLTEGSGIVKLLYLTLFLDQTHGNDGLH